MTKADIVKNISDKTGMDKSDVQMIAEKLMDEVKNSLKKNENVYLRGFGSFIIKKRAEKTGRNISKNIAVVYQLITFLHLNHLELLLIQLNKMSL